MASEPLSTWRIIREALKLPIKNPNLLLPILFLSLLISSILYLANYYTTYRLLYVLLASIYFSPPSPSINLKPLIIKLTILESIFFVISFIVSNFLLIATITATSVTHLTAQGHQRDIFTRVKTSWNGPFITQIIVSGLTFAFIMTIASLFVVTGGAIGGVLNASFGSKEPGSSSLVGGLMTVVVMGVWNLVMVAAYTVFYYDCRRSRGEEMVVSMERISYPSLYDSGYGKGDDV